MFVLGHGGAGGAQRLEEIEGPHRGRHHPVGGELCGQEKIGHLMKKKSRDESPNLS